MVEKQGVSDSVLARELGVTRLSILNWHDAGLPRFEDGSHDLEAVRAWVIQRKAGRTGGSKSKAEIRLLRVKARRQELELAKEKGELVLVRDVENFYAAKAALCRTKIVAMVEKVLMILPAEARSAARPTVEETVNSVLSDIAQTWASVEGVDESGVCKTG